MVTKGQKAYPKYTLPKKKKKKVKPLTQTTKKGVKKVKKKPLIGLKEIIPPSPIPIKPELNSNGKLIIKHPNIQDIPAPEDCYAVDITGKFKKKEKPTEALDIPMFWQTQRKKLAILMFFSSLFLFMSFMTLAEPYINFIYDTIMSLIWQGIWLFVSLFMGWIG